MTYSIHTKTRTVDIYYHDGSMHSMTFRTDDRFYSFIRQLLNEDKTSTIWYDGAKIQ